MIEEIRQRMIQGQFEFSLHATNQSIARKIPVSEIREMILTAEIIEAYPDDKYGPSLLLLGFTKAGRPLHLHLSTPARPLLKIITLYPPNPALWIDFRFRRTTDTP
jgi:Domain of unknown function (DUF4258)